MTGSGGASVVATVVVSVEIGGTHATEFVKGMTYGIALGVMIMGVLYTTGLMSKFQAFKLRLIGRE